MVVLKNRRYAELHGHRSCVDSSRRNTELPRSSLVKVPYTLDHGFNQICEKVLELSMIYGGVQNFFDMCSLPEIVKVLVKRKLEELQSFVLQVWLTAK